jgi:hypothetical protein
VLIAFVAVTPYLIEQLCAPEDAARVSSEMLEKIEFSRREIDSPAGSRHLATRRIDTDRASGDMVIHRYTGGHSFREIVDAP